MCADNEFRFSIELDLYNIKINSYLIRNNIIKHTNVRILLKNKKSTTPLSTIVYT